MKGFRWMSFLVVPASVLFAAGVYEMAGMAQRLFVGGRRWTMPGWLTATILVTALLPGFYLHSEWFYKKRETGPFSVQKRVNYTAYLEDRMFLEGRIRNLDVDMGAHMYWSEHLMVDMAGLIDLTIAHHNYSQRQVTKEYVFQEMRPQFAHVHGGWASTSRIPTFSEWEDQYFEVPGFPISKTTNHMGNHVRRDLLMHDRWRGPKERRVTFGNGVVLAGFKAKPEISVGKALFVELGVQYRKLRDKENFRLVAFLSNDQGALHTFDIPLGYDWLPPDEWRPEEVFVCRFAPLIHRSLRRSYDLGFAVFGADGRVVPAGVVEEEDGTWFQCAARACGGGRTRRRGSALRAGRGSLCGHRADRPLGHGDMKAREDFERAMFWPVRAAVVMPRRHGAWRGDTCRAPTAGVRRTGRASVPMCRTAGSGSPKRRRRCLTRWSVSRSPVLEPSQPQPLGRGPAGWCRARGEVSGVRGGVLGGCQEGKDAAVRANTSLAWAPECRGRARPPSEDRRGEPRACQAGT